MYISRPVINMACVSHFHFHGAKYTTLVHMVYKDELTVFQSLFFLHHSNTFHPIFLSKLDFDFSLSECEAHKNLTHIQPFLELLLYQSFGFVNPQTLDAIVKPKPSALAALFKYIT